MRVRATIAGVTVAAALFAGLPGQASAEPSATATAVHACLDYRERIGREAFRESFVNLMGCVENVVPSTD